MKKDDLYLMWDAKGGQWVKTERFADIADGEAPLAYQEYEGWPAFSTEYIIGDYMVIFLGIAVGNPAKQPYTKDMSEKKWTDCYVLKNSEDSPNALTLSESFAINPEFEAEWKKYKSLKWTNEQQIHRQEQLNKIISLIKAKKEQEADQLIELLLTQPFEGDERPKFIKEIIELMLSPLDDTEGYLFEYPYDDEEEEE